MVASPSHAQLGASLRDAAAVGRRLGDAHQWRPTSGSPARTSWNAGTHGDPLQLTLMEADVHAATLVRSTLEHSYAVGSAVTARRPYLPLSIGRTAVEHALRAQHLLDDEADPRERAIRRLDEWLYAVTESGYRRIGIQKAQHPGSELLDDESLMFERIRRRAQDLGLQMVKNSRGSGYRVSPLGRASTMQLAEQHLGAGGEGVPAFLIRNHSAVVHGVETGLLASAVDCLDPTTGVNVVEPAIADAPALAFGLMCIPLGTVNAIRALTLRFGWGTAGRPWGAYERSRDQMLQTWERAVEAHLDGYAPDRPRTAAAPYRRDRGGKKEASVDGHVVFVHQARWQSQRIGSLV